MELVLAIAIGVLTACGVWLLLRPRTFQVIIATFAVVVFALLLACGRVDITLQSK